MITENTGTALCSCGHGDTRIISYCILSRELREVLDGADGATLPFDGTLEEVSGDFKDFFAGEVTRIHQGLERYRCIAGTPVALEVKPVELPSVKALVLVTCQRSHFKQCSQEIQPAIISIIFS